VGRTRDILTGALLAFLPLAVVVAIRPPAAAATSSLQDTVLKTSTAHVLARNAATTEWGGPTSATDGEVVTLYFSNSYPVDPALALGWANFMTSLVHGSELSTVAIHLAPLAEVQRYCGRTAIACYDSDSATILSIGEDYDAETSAKGVLTHEYGHHVAESRLNPPFATVDYGTKRWATYENVCARARTGELVPGAEDALSYMLNPGEAFAETYRVLNEQKAGLAVEPWNIVSTLLFPDATALALLEQDVTQPWTQSPATKLTATLTKAKPSKSFVISTPYDGTLTIGASQSAATRVSLNISTSTTTLARTVATRVADPVTMTVCGKRTYTVKVKLSGAITKKTKTTFALSVLKP
jgi:hypothetical protein